MNARIITAATLAALGAGWALLTFRPWSHQTHPRTVPPIVNAADVDAVKTANPSEPIDLARTLDEFDAAVASALGALSADLALEATARDALVALARERLELLLDPSYERYLAQVARLTQGRSGSGGPNDRALPRDQWELYAKHFRDLPVDPARVQIRPIYRSGVELPAYWGGGTTVAYPPQGLYTSLGNARPGTDTGTDAYEVWIPARINDADTGQPVSVFLVMGFVRIPPSSQWLPWRIGFNDPSGEAAMITPPI